MGVFGSKVGDQRGEMLAHRTEKFLGGLVRDRLEAEAGNLGNGVAFDCLVFPLEVECCCF